MRAQILLTALSLAAERAATAFWPALAGFFVSYAALAFLHGSLALVHNAALIISGVAAALTVLWGCMRFRWPKREEVLSRLDETLPNRPLAALSDSQALGTADSASVNLWRLHQQRMQILAVNLKAKQPDLRLSRLDPIALRFSSATALVIALLFAPLPDLKFKSDASAASVNDEIGSGFDAWVEAPDYARLPGLYLNDRNDDVPVEVLAGSTVSIQFYRDSSECTWLNDQDSDEAKPRRDDTDFVQFEVVEAGRLSIGGKNCEERSWTLVPYADQPPEISLAGPAKTGSMGQFSQPLLLKDDFGVTKVEAMLALDLARVERMHGLESEPDKSVFPAAEIALPFGGSQTEFIMDFSADFLAHEWAGLPATLTIRGEDAAGLTSELDLGFDELPSRDFVDPFAAALVEQRRDVLWSGDNQRRAAQTIRALTHLPEDEDLDLAAYLMARTAVRMLEHSGEAGRHEVSQLLWQAALNSESGDILKARERMQRAAERLEEAMRKGAPPQEIERLAKLYRQAAEEFLEELKARARELAESGQDADGTANNSDVTEITEADIQQMMERMSQLLREGRVAEAESLLNQIRSMLENTVARSMQSNASPSETEQSRAELSKILEQQQELTDEVFRRQQELDKNQQVTLQEPPEDWLDEGNSTDAVADRQESLRQRLRSQMRDLGNLEGEGSGPLENFESADQAMTEARKRIRQNQLGPALEHQQQAMRSLAEGIRSLMEEKGAGVSGYGGPPGSGDQLVDPFGRRLDGGGLSTDAQLLPNNLAKQRSREVRDEIRDRLGDQDRQGRERKYLLRLLEPF